MFYFAASGAGLAEHLEHILLVRLDAGLVEGVDAGHVAGDGAGELEEADELRIAGLVAALHAHADVGHAAGDVRGLEGTGKLVSDFSKETTVS